MKKTKCVIPLGMLVILALVFSFAGKSASAPEKPMILKYSDPLKAGTSRTKAAEDTMREIDKRTGGRVKHEFYWAESLVKAKDSLDSIKAGTCDVGAAPDVVYHPARFPIWQFSLLMFIGGEDIYGMIKAWNEMAITNPRLKEEFDKQGVKFLATYGYPTTLICKKPLVELEDFKGLRIRATSAIAKWVSSLKGVAVPMTFYEVTEALSRGILDGTVGYLYTHYAYKHSDYCKFFTATPIAGQMISNTSINLGTWSKLPPDIQKIYEETWRDYFPMAAAKYSDEEAALHLKNLQNSGVKIIELNSAQYGRWKYSSLFLVDEYYKEMTKIGVDGKKTLEEYEKLYRKYERKK